MPAIIRVPNANQKPRTRAVDLLVIHAMAEWVIDGSGLYHHCTDYLHYEAGLSVHAFCLPDGRIVESVDPDLVAYHAREYNGCSVGIEVVVEGGHDIRSLMERMNDTVHPPYTRAQYESCAWWLRQQARRFGLSFSHIKRHAELAPGRKMDPGPAFDWQRLRDAFEAAAQAGEGDPTSVIAASEKGYSQTHLR